jgi:hypothetical protein
VHATVGGKIAQLGQRLIDGAAKSHGRRLFSSALTRRCSAAIRKRRAAAEAEPTDGAAAPARIRYDAGGGLPAWVWAVGAAVVLAYRLLGAMRRAEWRSCAEQGEGMENLDVMVLRTLRDWRAGRQARALLATVVRTWGSSPRPVGSIMALCEDGAVVGSVSGGCIEDDLIARFTPRRTRARSQADALPRASGPPGVFVKYGVTADEAHRFGLPCGGTLELLLEYDPDAAKPGGAGAALEGGQLMQRTRALADGVVTLEPGATRPPNWPWTTRAGQHLRPRIPHAAHRRRPDDRVPGHHGAVQRLRRDGVRPARGIPRQPGACPARAWWRTCPTMWSPPSSRPAQLRGGAHARPQAGRPGAAGGAGHEAFYMGALAAGATTRRATSA